MDEKKSMDGPGLTGFTSALPANQAQQYGTHATGVSDEEQDRIFGESDVYGNQEPVQQNKVVTKNNPVQQVPETTETQTIATSVQQNTENVEQPAPQPIPEGAETIEVEEGEYQHLKGLQPDELIAFGVKHRKTYAKLQSRIDKIKNVLGDKFIESVDKGEAPREAALLFNDLHDEAFQKHVAGFYDSHELREGKYIKTKQDTPPANILQEYNKLAFEQATLNVRSFIDKDVDFDANEAFSNPSSASGVALSKFERRKAEIENRLKEIESQSVNATPQAQDSEKVKEMGRRTWESFVNKNGISSDVLTQFQGYVSTNSPDLLNVFWKAFKADQSATQKTRSLVLREIRTVADNMQRTQSPSGAKTITNNNQHNLNHQEQLIAADAALFGDYPD